MKKPARLNRQAGRHALVDGIPFTMPVHSEQSPALMAAFTINADRAADLMPGNELHPFRLPNGKGLLVITVIDYRNTNIGKYIEYSIAIACTHGAKPAPTLLALLRQSHYGVGQYVYDLPVSTEISVKGGKGIWGMPKHQANLDFRIDSRWVSSQYDLDDQLCTRIEMKKPRAWLPVKLAASNFCAFRGMLMQSKIYFEGRVGFSLLRGGNARLLIGDHPRVKALHTLEISDKALMTAWFPSSGGVLDDHFEGWFLGFAQPPELAPEGMESVVSLDLNEDWLAPPSAAGRQDDAS
ncbi:MAG: hypothetical protein QOG44_758 [Acidimicrobiaceae bacterium]|jgi:hypothetical protein|nr:hypothetical protein [Acidimicrobiaceae bacterium]